MKTRAVIALGSNLGDREKTIQKALKQIAKLRGVELVVASKNYVSQALTETGFDPDQPEFINAVAIIDTKLAAKKLLSRLNEIESKFGRIRLARWAPRTLDLDIITYGTSLIETKSLIVPHPRAFERSFVLVPWLEIDPEAVLPGFGAVASLASSMIDEVRVQA
ncbi:MAG: 2-amino-4-hydroxy-6-hydroxymethyldihydropteridine diphosphokinase [Aquiluna sp.]|jgi:2-amino-4-hydroxy-6-hydroxymethyldihydropteridine diphosphokinase|nr:2-amino-4-hydroxy-6-hydroxymethyldihydropteridine diphosphokinase [Aquiluna sp.]